MPQLQSTISDARFKEIAHLAHRQLLEENLWYFCTKSGITLDGKPFSFDRHEYLEEPYKVIRECREMVFEKAAQMGISTLVLLNAFHGCKNLAYPHGVLYLLPSKTDVTDFSKSKAQGILDENPNMAKWVTDTDTANIKKIGKAIVFFRGMCSRVGLKCHDDKTEVLTHEGWKYFKDVTMKDEVATRSPTGSFMWQQVTNIANLSYKGKMFEFKANGLNFCVTPNHRLLLTDHENPDREWIDTAERILPKLNSHLAVVRTCKDWDGIIPEFAKRNETIWCQISITGRSKNSRWKHLGNYPDRIVNLRDWVAFLGIYVAEGSTSGVRSGKFTAGRCRVSISQKTSSPNFRYIKSLLNRLPFDWKYASNSFYIDDIELAKIMFPLGNKYTKELPQWVLDLPSRYLKVLWKFAVMGDGHITKPKNGRKPYCNYATVSKKLADQFQEVLQKIGLSSSILIQTPSKNLTLPGGRKPKSISTLYLVSERRSRCSTVPKPTEIDYDGRVYCVSVPNSVVYTRRNGYAIWSGNTISVDLTIFDEIEEVEDWSLVALAEERMSHVENPSIHRLSVPSIPGYGVDAYFAGSDDIGIPPSDQRYWMIKCEHCGEYNCLEDEFPDCIIEVSAKDQTAIRACKKCKRELNISIGRWVAKEPGRYVRGYHFSQLFSHYINPWKILDQFRKKRELSTLFNDKLGIPYVEAEARLETKEVLALCGSDPQLASFEGPAAMGIDQPKEEGGKFHVTIAYRMSGQPCNIIRVCVRNKWNDLADLMKTHNVARCVVDAQPDQAKAREFAKEFQGRVYLCFYAEKQRGAYRWNDDQMTVSVDRTESLNASTRAVHESSMSLPRKDDEIIQFARQLHNIARKKEEDKDTGNVRQIWIKTGADHWRHSYNYCFLALPEIGEYVKPRNDREWKRKKNRGASSWKTV